MKKHNLVKYLLVTLAFVAVLGLALVSIGASRRPRTATQNGGNAADNRTLKEKAKQARRFVGTEEPNMATRYTDLNQLAGHSSAVVIGTAQQNVCRLSADGKRITIDYSVKLEYVYQGSLKQGNTITVSLPGGSVEFPDGSSAEIQTPWFKKMQEGTTYLLFLNEAAGGRAFVTTGQAQGVFEIPTSEGSRTVKTHTGVMRDPMWKYQNMDVKVFLREVRKAIKKGS